MSFIFVHGFDIIIFGGRDTLGLLCICAVVLRLGGLSWDIELFFYLTT